VIRRIAVVGALLTCVVGVRTLRAADDPDKLDAQRAPEDVTPASLATLKKNVTVLFENSTAIAVARLDRARKVVAALCRYRDPKNTDCPAADCQGAGGAATDSKTEPKTDSMNVYDFQELLDQMTRKTDEGTFPPDVERELHSLMQHEPDGAAGRGHERDPAGVVKRFERRCAAQPLRGETRGSRRRNGTSCIQACSPVMSPGRLLSR